MTGSLDSLEADLRRVCAAADPPPPALVESVKALHRYAPDVGIRCGRCAATAGYIETGRRWTCGTCGTTGPVAGYHLIPGMRGDADGD